MADMIKANITGANVEVRVTDYGVYVDNKAIESILKDLGFKFTAVNNYRDALFAGSTPDVNKSNMEKLLPVMKKNNAILGVALDGDADRFGIIDSEGNFITPNEVIYLLMYYLIKTRGWKTSVGRTVATTYMVDRLAEKYGVEVIETPVGFKCNIISRIIAITKPSMPKPKAAQRAPTGSFGPLS
jgi:phosphomannomutase